MRGNVNNFFWFFSHIVTRLRVFRVFPFHCNHKIVCFTLYLYYISAKKHLSGSSSSEIRFCSQLAYWQFSQLASGGVAAQRIVEFGDLDEPGQTSSARCFYWRLKIENLRMKNEGGSAERCIIELDEEEFVEVIVLEKIKAQSMVFNLTKSRRKPRRPF